jgi:hypothetical protein
MNRDAFLNMIDSAELRGADMDMLVAQGVITQAERGAMAASPTRAGNGLFGNDYNADGTPVSGGSGADDADGAAAGREAAVPEGQCPLLTQLFGNLGLGQDQAINGHEDVVAQGQDGTYLVTVNGEQLTVPVSRDANINGGVDETAIYNAVATANGMYRVIDDLFFDSRPGGTRTNINMADGLSTAEEREVISGFASAFTGMPNGTQVTFTYGSNETFVMQYQNGQLMTQVGNQWVPVTPENMPDALVTQIYQQGQAAAQATNTLPMVQMDVAVPSPEQNGGMYYVDTQLIRTTSGSGLQLEYQNAVNVATPVVAGHGQGQGAGIGGVG